MITQHTDTDVIDISTGTVYLLAIASGLIVANLYYAQTLVGPISVATGLSPEAAGLVVTLTQIGYCLGLIFVVPLGDLIENRRLIFLSLLLTAAALAAAASTSNATLFLGASLMVGLGSVAAQILVPFAAHLSLAASRGQVIGKVMSGLLLGIMLARPVASLVADLFGWHAIFILSAAATGTLAFVLLRMLPHRQPTATIRYLPLLASMWHLLMNTPVLRRRAVYHACMFGAFSLFWTTVPLLLAGPEFQLSQRDIALFALVGVAGAIAAPIAGRMADRGWTWPATASALGLGLFALSAPLLIHTNAHGNLAILVISSIILDMGVSANLVLGQRAIFSLGAQVRSRLNGLFMSIFFIGGATGSALGAWVYATYGWDRVLWVGVAFPAAAIAYFATERR